MYVCLCNGFTDRQVRALCPVAVKSVGAVYEALGVKPKCGKCVPTVRQILSGPRGLVAEKQALTRAPT